MKLSRLLLSLSSAALAATGKVREYNLTLQSTYMSKDGNGRPYLTINGDTPGPVIEGDEGDTIRVHVENRLFTETTMHWHGVYQVDKFWNDGVPGVTQWPIEPRGTYTYEFTLTNQTGIYFYHGHFGPAFADGQRGPLWIRPAHWRPRPYEVIATDKDDFKAMMAAEKSPRHLMVSDWNFVGMDILTIMFRDTGVQPACSASLVTNGKGRTICLSRDVLSRYEENGRRDTMGCLIPETGTEYMNEIQCKDTSTDFEVVQANKGEKYLFINFIHPGAHHELLISIDNHNMWVVAADGDFTYPKKVQAFNLNMGERISVLVPLDQEPGEYAIRMVSLSMEQVIQGFSILRYPGVQETRKDGVLQLPKSTPFIDVGGDMIGDAVKMDEMIDLSPFPPRPPPAKSDHTLKLVANRTQASTWVLASEPHQGFRQQLPPILWNERSRGPTTFGGLKNGSTVDIIYESAAGGMHPFHKHNHKAWIIGRGTGGFPWPDVATALREAPDRFNLVDPPLRDGARLGGMPGSWTVIRYTITFPAMSMLHCHRIAHFAGGQQIVLVEGQEAFPEVPEYIKNMTHSEFVPPVRYGPLD
ncbi:laccase TilA [Xylaria cubensis]|nr:laccase TilA [Xylaria cubensis]